MIGLWLLVTSIPNLFGIFAYHVRITNESSGFVYSPEQQAVMIKNMVTSAISIMIGLWLVLGNKGISKAIDTIINIPISKRKEE